MGQDVLFGEQGSPEGSGGVPVDATSIMMKLWRHDVGGGKKIYTQVFGLAGISDSILSRLDKGYDWYLRFYETASRVLDNGDYTVGRSWFQGTHEMHLRNLLYFMDEDYRFEFGWRYRDCREQLTGFCFAGVDSEVAEAIRDKLTEYIDTLEHNLKVTFKNIRLLADRVEEILDRIEDLDIPYELRGDKRPKPVTST